MAGGDQPDAPVTDQACPQHRPLRNGSIFEVILVISFIALGAFSDFRFFAIPAGASVFLLFTMLLMVISALFSWMQGWTGTVIIMIVVVLNILSQRTDRFLYDNHAFGMDYTVEPATYDRETISALANDTRAAERDAEAITGTLELWKKKNEILMDGPKSHPWYW